MLMIKRTYFHSRSLINVNFSSTYMYVDIICTFDIISGHTNTVLQNIEQQNILQNIEQQV